MRRTGLEPAHLAASAPQADVSTNSTTAAFATVITIAQTQNKVKRVAQGFSANFTLPIALFIKVIIL